MSWVVWILFIFFMPALLLWGAIWFLSRRVRLVPRSVLLVSSATLLLTPSWAPATIVAVPVPFVVLLGIAAVTGAWDEVAELVMLFPIWHAVAFPATAVVFYVLVRKLLSNKRFQDDGLASRGRA